MDKHTKNSATRKTRAVAGKGQRHLATGHEVAAPFAIGVDLGDRYSNICVFDDGDAVQSEGRIRTTEAGMREFFERLAPARVALETGTHSGWVSRLLAACGHEVVVANARELRKIHQSNRKNDRADARILARMVRFDPQLLSPIEHRSAAMQADTALLRTREALVSTRARFTNTARGLVKAIGGRLPTCSTASFARQVRGQIPIELQAALKPLVAMVEALSQQICACDEQIAALAHKRYPETALLEQIAGVGTLTAVAFILALADKQRFAHSRDVGPYLGLVPRQADSGERSPQLGITKAGNPYMRRLLVGSAQYILGPFGPDTDLRRYGLRLAQRGGKNAKKRAIVAVARKLAVLMHRLWVTGEIYDPLRNTKRHPESIAV
ncbi:MAG: IS110 family RNA-guided transposase [Vulcanimicrobiaceae bacterium]